MVFIRFQQACVICPSHICPGYSIVWISLQKESYTHDILVANLQYEGTGIKQNIKIKSTSHTNYFPRAGEANFMHQEPNF